MVPRDLGGKPTRDSSRLTSWRTRRRLCYDPLGLRSPVVDGPDPLEKEVPDMSQLSRPSVPRGTAAAARPHRARAGCPRQKRGGTVRFVPQADLKVLDPIWTTAYITRNHSYRSTTRSSHRRAAPVKPQMVQTWSVAARGLRCRSRCATASAGTTASRSGRGRGRVDQALGPADPLGKLLLAHTAKLVGRRPEGPSRSELAQPFALPCSRHSASPRATCLIMPARVAATPETERSRRSSARGRSGSSRTEWQPG